MFVCLFVCLFACFLRVGGDFCFFFVCCLYCLRRSFESSSLRASLCMLMHICVNVGVCVHVHIYLCMWVWLCVTVYVCVSAAVCVHLASCLCLWICFYVCVHVSLLEVHFYVSACVAMLTCTRLLRILSWYIFLLSVCVRVYVCAPVLDFVCVNIGEPMCIYLTGCGFVRVLYVFVTDFAALALRRVSKCEETSNADRLCHPETGTHQLFLSYVVA